MYLVVGCVGLVTYAFAAVFVYSSEKDFEQSATNTCAEAQIHIRTNTNELEEGKLPHVANARTETGVSQTGSNGGERVRAATALSNTPIRSDPEKQSRQETVRPGRRKKQLLY